ncbi:MAG: glycosyltransferase family 2 protein [Anaerolineae bacterium]|nr:glycosyltransferase family 2 protein [Anaerolineae bacterium]
MSSIPDWPFISVVMPVRNEAAFIARSLGAMLAQDYPPDRLEVIVVDGQSDDGTREIVAGIAARDPRVRLVDNPRRIIPIALNLGIRAARYPLIARMDGHTIAAPDYLRRCVQIMAESGADNVGGCWEYAGEGWIGQAIAAAMESRFGVGPGRWRGPVAGEADTVPYGFYRRERLLALGGFDEVYLTNEDYELNYRLRASGGRIVYSPEIWMTYYVRPCLIALGRQYFRYGYWKARMLRQHPRSLRPRQLAAPLLVAGLVVGTVLQMAGGFWRAAYVVAVGLYLLLAAVFSLRQAARRGWRLLPGILVAFLVLHLAWGTGFWYGVWRWMIRRADHR